MTTLTIGIAGVLALATSLLLPLAVIPLLSRLGAIDIPTARSMHSGQAIRGVGIAPMIASAVAFGLLLAVDVHDGMMFVVLGIAALCSGVLGASEDLRGVSVPVRAAAQLLIGCTAATAVVVPSGLSWALVPLFGFAFAGYVNVANFMDGVDGISGLHGIVVGVAFAVSGSLTGMFWLVAAGCVLAAAFAGFLPWNLLRRGTFLGDAGSYFLGACIAMIAILAVSSGLPVLTILAPLVIYLTDTSTTFIRRMSAGDRLTHSHRGHVYQRLASAGYSHIRTALTVTAFTLITAGLGLFALIGSVVWTVVASVCIVLTAAGYLALPALLRRSTPDAAGVADQLEGRTSSIAGFRPGRWAVVGASGFIGGAVVGELNRRGTPVSSVVAPRLAVSPYASANDMIALAAESKEVNGLAAQLRGIDVVINAAGVADPGSRATEELYGANALLPTLVAVAAGVAGVTRVIHLSSAAVQGRRPVIDESPETSPFSPYSLSKAMGERTLLTLAAAPEARRLPELILLRATSVQGAARETTKHLMRVAGSRVASVARPGDRPTVVSSLDALVDFVISVGEHESSVPPIVLQPWEGLTTASALRLAGGREPIQIPAILCRAILAVGYAIGVVIPRIAGTMRRVELMWFGQEQRTTWADSVGYRVIPRVVEAFSDADEAG